ncbi:hypothetical protein PF010_g27297 [Phytophthora fragariae]|uniref:Myb/SANT-like domain-containing protein n=4 Tax=Phytophthora fragariae TaxID=53985 RepID=A0A6A3HA86_9STRA|nr:hypothetical protein PF011_g27818 [Phytophthora fragariae]KAE9067854.1 hypothetical protein PF010_g27297 [Phytophthora fragariae]
MPGIEALVELVRVQLDDAQFRVVDPNKRSRFCERDLIKLVQIVTRRKTYKTPHGKGEEEWQAVADKLNEAVKASFSPRACRDKVSALLREHKRATAASRRASGVVEQHTGLSDLIEGYLQLKTRFDEAQQAEKDKKKRKLKRLSAAGNKAMRNGAQRLKRRKAEASRQERSNAPDASEDDAHAVQHDASEAESATNDERTGLRSMLGSEYSSDEETKWEDNEESDQTEEHEEEETQSGHKVGRTRLRVSEIWAREEAMMAKDRAAQAARDNALTRAVETLANTTQLLLQHFGSGSANRSSTA